MLLAYKLHAMQCDTIATVLAPLAYPLRRQGCAMSASLPSAGPSLPGCCRCWLGTLHWPCTHTYRTAQQQPFALATSLIMLSCTEYAAQREPHWQPTGNLPPAQNAGAGLTKSCIIQASHWHCMHCTRYAIATAAAVHKVPY